jgi:hypothetical protein
MVLKLKWSRTLGLTVKIPLVPDIPELVVKSVIPDPAPVTVIEPVQTPFEKLPVLVGLIVPIETFKELIPT